GAGAGDSGPPGEEMKLRLPRPLTLFLLTMLVICVGLALCVGLPLFQHRAAVRHIREMGGAVDAYPHGLSDRVSNWLDADQIEEFGRVESVIVADAFGDSDAALLPYVAEVEHLQLLETQITDEGMRHLKNLKNLRSLWVDATKIGDDGLAHLAGLVHVKSLHLGRTRVTSAGMQHLKKLAELEELTLGDTAVDDSGMAYLESLPRLRILKLDRTRISDAGLQNVGRQPG